MPLPRILTEHAIRFWPEAGDAPGVQAGDAQSVAIVTAFFDIGREGWGAQGAGIGAGHRRGVEKYMEYFARLALLPNEMVVFVEPALAGRVLELRQAAGLGDRTVIYTIERIFDLPEVAPLARAVGARMSETLRRFVWRPDAPECNDPNYVMVNALKSSFVLTALDLGAIGAAQVAWIDFGYCRSAEVVGPAAEWRFDTRGAINLFCCAEPDARPVYDIVRGGAVYFQGCHIVGPVGAWAGFNARLALAFDQLLGCDLVDDDQTLLLMAWRAAPEEFVLHRVRLDGPLGWFFIFRRCAGNSAPLCDAIAPIAAGRTPDWLRESKAAWRRWRSGGR